LHLHLKNAEIIRTRIRIHLGTFNALFPKGNYFGVLATTGPGPVIARFQQSLLAELAPQGATETITFHELLHAAWNLERFRRIESELSTGRAEDFTSAENAAVYDRLTRYQIRAQRAYYRALAALRTLHPNRALRTVKLEDTADPKVPAITNINELTKQAHSEVEAEALRQALQILDLETAAFVRASRRKRAVSIAE